MGRAQERQTPEYDLSEVKRLVRSGQFVVSSRPRNFIVNHEGLNVMALVVDLIDSIEPSDFYKSTILRNIPGVMGDVYRHIPYESILTGRTEEWYVKFYVDSDSVIVTVLSANYEGGIH